MQVEIIHCLREHTHENLILSFCLALGWSDLEGIYRLKQMGQGQIPEMAIQAYIIQLHFIMKGMNCARG